jgi:hypothetical protein
MLQTLAFLLSTVAITSISALPQAETPTAKWNRHCPPFERNFTINQYQLYPENLDFDFRNCLLYLGFVSLK